MHEDDIDPPTRWQGRGAWAIAFALMFSPIAMLIALVVLLLAGCSGCATDLPTQRSEAAPGPQWLDAGRLADICAVDGRACAAYLAATDDLMLIGARRRVYCAPPKVALPALRASFLDYVEEHPDARDAPATAVALTAWMASWPCDEVGGAGPDPRPDVPRQYRL